jgi:hypothetical protein
MPRKKDVYGDLKDALNVDYEKMYLDARAEIERLEQEVCDLEFDAGLLNLIGNFRVDRERYKKEAKRANDGANELADRIGELEGELNARKTKSTTSVRPAR